MRNIVLALATAGAVLVVGAGADRANAVVTGASAGLRAAVDEINIAEVVHCRPGWRHHVASWGLWDGCSRVPAVVVVRPRPRFYEAPRRRGVIIIR